MAEAKSADSARSAGVSPKLVPVPEGPAPENRKPAPAETLPRPGLAQPERSGVSRGLFGLVALMLLLAFVGLLAQTRRAQTQAEQIAALTGQVEGLEVQLSAANTQIATYDMQRSLVQASVSQLFEQMANLHELVQMDPLAGTPPSQAAGQ